MSGGVVEQDVILDADGGPVFRAFEQIEKRLKKFQAEIDLISVKAGKAGLAFDNGLQVSMGTFNKMASMVTAFEKNLSKLDPNIKKAEEVNKAYAQREKILIDGQNKRAKQEAMLWAQQEQRERNSEESKQKRYERLAEQRIAREQAAQIQSDQKVERVRDQNRLKRGRERMRQDVDSARTLTDLENQRAIAADRITRARGAIGKVSADEERQAYQIIAQERERLRLVNQRIKAEKPPGSDARIDQALNVRSAKAQERELAAGLALRDAKMRQAELETNITNQIARAKTLTGQQKIEAERALKIDEARLGVVNRRVNALERENRAQVKAAQPRSGMYGPPVPPGYKPPRAPAGGGGKSGPGLFGATGLGGVFLRTAAYGGAAAALYGTISMLREGVSAAVEFEDSLKKIQAVAGLTDTQTAKLGESIRDVARNSRFATNEIADATMVMAQAGFSASDIGDALQNVANMAAAAGTTMAEATDVVTSVIGAFQLQTSETGHVADVLAAALNDTKLNIQQVALGIQYAGQTAYENKISFDELTASMATMAQAGIRSGSTIGTGMRMFLTDLMSPTKKLAKELDRLGLSMADIDVKTLGLPEVLARLSSAGFGAANAYASLEKRSAAAYLVLKNNQDILNEEIIRENRVGAAAEAAAKGQASLAAEWQRTKNIIAESAASAFGPLLDGIRDVLHGYNELASDKTLRGMLQELDKLPKYSKAWWDQRDAVLAYKESLEDTIDMEGFNATAIEESTTALNEANEKFNQTEQSVHASTDAIARLVQRQASLKDGSSALAAETASLMNRFGDLASQLYGTAASYDNLLKSMQAVRQLQIQMGALQANDRYMAADQQAHAYDARKSQMANQLINSGVAGKLPAKEWGALGYLISHPDGPKAGESSALLYDYAQKTGGLIGRQLTDFVQTATKTGMAMYQKDQAKLDRDKFRALGSSTGQKVFAEIDASQGKSSAYIKNLADKYRKNSVDPRYSQAEQAAWDYLATIEESKIGSGEGPRAPESKGSKKGAHDQQRRDRTINRMALKAAEAELKQSIKGLLDRGGGTSSDGDAIVVTASKKLTREQFAKNLQRVQDALDDWEASRTKQVEEQIEDQKMSPEEAAMMRADLKQEIATKREEAGRDVAKRIIDALDVMVEAITKTAEDAKAAADQQVAIAQARVNSLSRSGMEGRVPDYVQQTYERRVGEATDARDQAYIAINEHQIEALRQKLNEANQMLMDAKTAGLRDKAGEASDRIDELNRQIVQLTYSNEALKASFGGDGLIPKSFNDQLSMAIENYRKVNNLTASFGEMIGMNLTDAIGTAHQSLTQFLDDATSGTMSVQAAWGNMVKNIIGYLRQLLVKMIAVKLMEMALGLFGGSKMPAYPGPATDLGLNPTTGAIGMFYGGPVKGAFRGEHIQDGVPSRDSTYRKVAKGEFIMRRPAVESLGVDFVKRMNERGVSALQSLVPKVMVPPPSQQMMNVYVVAPEHQPTMGPNDVLVTIADDIYRGGPTKQLIKQVAQGA